VNLKNSSLSLYRNLPRHLSLPLHIMTNAIHNHQTVFDLINWWNTIYRIKRILGHIHSLLTTSESYLHSIFPNTFLHKTHYFLTSNTINKHFPTPLIYYLHHLDDLFAFGLLGSFICFWTDLLCTPLHLLVAPS